MIWRRELIGVGGKENGRQVDTSLGEKVFSLVGLAQLLLTQPQDTTSYLLLGPFIELRLTFLPPTRLFTLPLLLLLGSATEHDSWYILLLSIHHRSKLVDNC